MEKSGRFKNSRGRNFTWKFVEDIKGKKEMMLIPDGALAINTDEVNTAEEAEALARKVAEEL